MVYLCLYSVDFNIKEVLFIKLLSLFFSSFEYLKYFLKPKNNVLDIAIYSLEAIMPGFGLVIPFKGFNNSFKVG